MLSRRESKLQKAIDKAVRELEDYPIASREFETILNRLSKLYELQAKDKPASVSPDTLAMIAANLVSIVLIIKHEQFNVITSRAMNFVRLR